MENQITKNQPKFSVMLQTDAYKKLINNTLGDLIKAQKFVASISSVVATNPQLQECESGSILAGALLGETLNLSLNPQLGQFYLIPFNNTKKGVKEATFILGAKGYKQLAIRSGQYKDIDFIEVREGEYLGRDEETGKQTFKFIQDDDVRESKPIIGYLAYFELLNGFRKQIYWSKTKMEKHADKYSKAFNLADYKKLLAGQIPQKDMWKYSSYWYTDFDGMAEKTLYRQLISKYGVMSVEMTEAFTKDTTVLRENGEYEYVDNPQVEEANIIEHSEEKIVTEKDTKEQKVKTLDEI